jgi:hypothetical protein
VTLATERLRVGALAGMGTQEMKEIKEMFFILETNLNNYNNYFY